MESWITILATLALMILGAVIDAKKKKAKQSNTSFTPSSAEILRHMGIDSSSVEDYGFDSIEEEYVDDKSETIVEETIEEEKPLFEEGGFVTQSPIISQEEENFFQNEKEKEKRKIDLKNLIIYSELLKPKYQDF